MLSRREKMNNVAFTRSVCYAYCMFSPGSFGGMYLGFNPYFFVPMVILVNTAIEIVVLYLLSLRSKREILIVFIVNITSWPIFMFSITRLSQMLEIFLLELLVIISETIILCMLLKKYAWSKILPKVAFANVFSVLTGYLLTPHLYRLTQVIGKLLKT